MVYFFESKALHVEISKLTVKIYLCIIKSGKEINCFYINDWLYQASAVCY